MPLIPQYDCISDDLSVIGPCPLPDRISVVLVDDHALVRRGFRRILEDSADIWIVGEASDGVAAIKMAQELNPRVMIMDCALPGMSGLAATRRIAEVSIGTN